MRAARGPGLGAGHRSRCGRCCTGAARGWSDLAPGDDDTPGPTMAKIGRCGSSMSPWPAPAKVACPSPRAAHCRGCRLTQVGAPSSVLLTERPRMFTYAIGSENDESRENCTVETRLLVGPDPYSDCLIVMPAGAGARGCVHDRGAVRLEDLRRSASTR